jgi:hypothetical protein
LNNLLFIINGCEACRHLALIVEEDMRLASLTINWEKSDGIPLQERIHLGFIVNLAEGVFEVIIYRWKALKSSVGLMLSSKCMRVQARKLASLVGTVISMKLAWGPITHYILGICVTFLTMYCLLIVGSQLMMKLSMSYILERST